MTEIRPAHAEDIPAVRALIEEYCRWLDSDLAFQGIAAELEGLPGEYAPPRGALLVALVGGRIEGLVACRPFDAGTCEVKRLYVRPTGRGLGLARALVVALMRDAASRGYRRMVLDTLPTMAPAQRLYESLGFVDIPAYYDTPIPETRFMARPLA